MIAMTDFEAKIKKINEDYEAKAKGITDAHAAKIKKIEEEHAARTKEINRKFRRDMIIIGFVAVIVLAIIVWALIHDHAKSVECKARKCPGLETPAYIEDKCICVTEASP